MSTLDTPTGRDRRKLRQLRDPDQLRQGHYQVGESRLGLLRLLDDNVGGWAPVFCIRIR